MDRKAFVSTVPTETKTTDLKPCPFCGSEARLYEGINNTYGVVCTQCGVAYEFMCKGMAEKAWNQRCE